jgi:calpain
MIGLYLLEKREGKLSYSEDTVVNQTSFMPVKTITMETLLGSNKPLSKSGYIIMPSTYESKVQGSFILSVKCDRPFELSHSK